MKYRKKGHLRPPEFSLLLTMISNRQLFQRHVAQTSPSPLSLEIEKAEGVFLYDRAGKKYLDLISGISVSNIGHCNPEVVNAIKNQAEKFMHLMVYGEYIHSPQVQLSAKIASLLPKNLNTCYIVNSGAEAVEGALKLAKRYTGKTNIVTFSNSYHGSTHGALSVMGNESFKNSFRPLLPGISIGNFNDHSSLELIDEHTAAVIIEPIQSEAGIISGDVEFFKSLRKKCHDKGALLILDEIQTAFGRTGSMFAFEKMDFIPDVLLLAKAMGGGMPIGAFVSSNEIMSALSSDPVLGHITTFGGHPVSCAASLAAINFLERNSLIKDVRKKEELFISLLKHNRIKEIRSEGLLIAVEFSSFEENKLIIDRCIENGVITDWFLFNDRSMRIAPPLIITEDEVKKACTVILRAVGG